MKSQVKCSRDLQWYAGIRPPYWCRNKTLFERPIKASEGKFWLCVALKANFSPFYLMKNLIVKLHHKSLSLYLVFLKNSFVKILKRGDLYRSNTTVYFWSWTFVRPQKHQNRTSAYITPSNKKGNKLRLGIFSHSLEFVRKNRHLFSDALLVEKTLVENKIFWRNRDLLRQCYISAFDPRHSLQTGWKGEKQTKNVSFRDKSG